MRLAQRAALTFLLASTAAAPGGAESVPVVPLPEVSVTRAPEAGGPRRFQVIDGQSAHLRQAPDANATVLSTVAGGALLRNFGCRGAARDVWCEVRPLSGGKRGFVRHLSLHPAKGPDGTIPLGPDDSARRARAGDVDARARIPCAQIRDQPLQDCTLRIARSGGGDGTALVTFANGFTRELYFVNGAFASANATMSGNGTDIDWRMENGLFLIRVDDQRYRVPVSLLLEP